MGMSSAEHYIGLCVESGTEFLLELLHHHAFNAGINHARVGADKYHAVLAIIEDEGTSTKTEMQPICALVQHGVTLQQWLNP